MIELRPYQSEAIQLLQDGFRKHKRQVLCLPTGAGKTVTFAEMISRAASKGTRCLILTDRIELFQQSFRAIASRGIHPEVLHAGTESVPAWSLITLAMVETLYRRHRSGSITLDPQLIIIDEAHKGNFTKVLDLFPDCYVIGATATPVGKHFHKYYSSIVNNIDIPELIKQGYLVPCKALQMVADLSHLEVRNGEYTEASLYQHYSKTALYEGVIEQYIERAYGTKALCFCVNIRHAEETAENFRKVGIRAECVTSHTPQAERERILADFHAGKFLVLTNCGVLTTGYDEPSIETIIMNRATLSLPLFLQCLGRGSRPYPEKTYFTVLDFGMNHERFGLWQDPRPWSLKPPKKGSAKDGVAPKKICPVCSALLPASATECEFCEHIFEKELLTGKMVEVSSLAPTPVDLRGKRLSQCTVEELITLLNIGRYRFPFITRVLRTRGEDALREFQQRKGYKSGWVYAQMQYKDRTGFHDVIIT